MKESDFENMCLGVQNNPPKIVFGRRATREDIIDAVAGQLLLATRKFVGATATKSIDPPARGQSHSEARIQAIVRVVGAHSSELFNPHVQINEMIDAVLARCDKFRRA